MRYIWNISFNMNISVFIEKRQLDRTVFEGSMVTGHK